MVADSEGTETEETSPAGEPPNKSKLIKIEVSILLSIFWSTVSTLESN